MSVNGSQSSTNNNANTLAALQSLLGGSSGSGSTGTGGPISFSGVASGLNTTSIIQALLQADQIPITNLQNQESTLNTNLSALQQFAQGLQAFGQAASALNSAAAFNPINASSSDSTVATLTADNTANAGTYSLTVTQLAQAGKISSAAQTDTTSALNLAGTMVINGHGVQVVASDSLTSIAQKINGLSAGVTASVINGGTGSAYLTVTANQSGAANAIQVADMQGNVAASLGIITASDAVRVAGSGGGATSYSFSSQSTSLASMLNANSIGSQSFSINGVAVNFDPNSTTLQGLANDINAANTGATASISTTKDANGNTTYQLALTGMTSFTDTSGFLNSIGVLQHGYGNQILQAQDAKYTLDNLNLTSSTNTVTGVIQGVTLQLLKGTPSSPASTTLNLTQDESTVDKSVQGFVSAYNALQSYVAQNSQLDTTTFNTGPLFGNSTVQSVQSQLSNNLFQTIPGLPNGFNNLASIGFGLDQNGNMTLNQSTFDNAMHTNPQAVAQLFQATGTSSNSAISYVSDGSKTVSSGTGSYAINISQAATEGVFTASAAQTQPLAANELLTFGGSLLGNTNYELLLSQGETQSQVASQINSDSTLKNLVNASVVNGKLTITSKKYGANGNFTLTSDTSASSSSSGLQGGTLMTGLDVAGTINGEPATGTGQFLTGNSGNATTDSLQIQYTGSATGNVGSITFNKGVGAALNDLVGSLTDPANGMITAAENTINTQITNITSQITQLQQTEQQDQANLQNEFNAMETAISNLRNQAAQMNAILGNTSSSTTSTTPTNAAKGG